MANKPKLNQPDVEISVTQPNITIEKATPEQFISGVKGYMEILECGNEELKKRINVNEYTIKQLKIILNSPVLEVSKDD